MLAAFGVMMGYLLLFRISVPYVLVRQHPERTLLALLPAFEVWARAVEPIVSRIRRRAAPDRDEPEDGAAAPELPTPPVREENEARLVDALDRFSATLAREVMTPRPDVVAIAAAAPVSALRGLMGETKYSRIPVYGKDLDDILGVVEVRDLLDYRGGADSRVGGLVRPVHLVPETKRIPDMLREMQGRRMTFAVVIDEYGGTAGIATIEDIVEELVGEINDEYDVEGDPLTMEPDGGVVADGRASVDSLEEALGAELRLEEEIDTVGGLVTSVFGRIPRPGERTVYRGFALEVIAAERRRVNRVRFTPAATGGPD
jgi:putative hemolysin